MTEVANDIAPIHKRRVINRPRADVFRVFVDRMGDWWPAQCESGDDTQFETVRFTRTVGDRLTAVLSGGGEMHWGRLMVFEEPVRLVFSWHYDTAEEEASEVEVTFATLDDDRTQVDLYHRNWEKMGARAAGERAKYDEGWDFVFGECFATACERLA